MADIAEDLILHLKSHASGIGDLVGNRIHQTHMPQRSDWPAIFLIRSSRHEELTLDGRKVTPLVEENWDLEVLDSDLDSANDVAHLIPSTLHGIRGSEFLGTTNTVQGIFVEDKDDDYIPRGAGTDEGISVLAFGVKIWYLDELSCDLYYSSLTLEEYDILTLDQYEELCL